MPTNITIENALGTELVIPEAGTKRRGEITITANHGFFSVNRTDQVNIPFMNTHKLTNAGATITGNIEDINNDVPIENIPADIFGCRVIRNSDSGSSANGIAEKLDGSFVGMYRTGSDANATIQTFQNMHGQDIKVFRKDGANGINYYLQENHYTDTKYIALVKDTIGFLLFNIYIEDDTINNDTILTEFGENFRLYRDRYQTRDNDGNWQDAVLFGNNYKLPAQQWITFEIDVEIGDKDVQISRIKDNVKITDDDGGKIITGINQNTKVIYNSSEIRLAYNGDDTDNNYIKYSPIFFLGKEKGVDLLGQDGWTKFVESMKRLITPI